MGTSTSRYVRKKKITEEQRKRNEEAIKKLNKMNSKKQKSIGLEIFHNPIFNARHFYVHIVQ